MLGSSAIRRWRRCAAGTAPALVLRNQLGDANGIMAGGMWRGAGAATRHWVEQASPVPPPAQRHVGWPARAVHCQALAPTPSPRVRTAHAKAQALRRATGHHIEHQRGWRARHPPSGVAAKARAHSLISTPGTFSQMRVPGWHTRALRPGLCQHPLGDQLHMHGPFRNCERTVPGASKPPRRTAITMRGARRGSAQVPNAFSPPHHACGPRARCGH